MAKCAVVVHDENARFGCALLAVMGPSRVKRVGWAGTSVRSGITENHPGQAPIRIVYFRAAPAREVIADE